MPFRTIVHVDMDAFFASVEILDHPELKGKAVVVGADPLGRIYNGHGTMEVVEENSRVSRTRGVVCAASYEARKFGVRSAQPVKKAYQLCPEAIFLPPRFYRYSEISDRVMNSLQGFSDKLLRLSIDEAVMDASLQGIKYGTWKILGEAIKKAIFEATGLTATAGIATGRTLAKMASEIKKPDGLYLVPPGKEKEFLAPLKVEAIPGVGPRAKEILNRVGVHIIADLQKLNAETLVGVLGKWGMRLYELAQGIDNEPIETSRTRKSFGEECTYDTDLASWDNVNAALADLATSLTRSMSRKKISGRTMTLKIRFADFHTITRSQTFPVPISDAGTMQSRAQELLARSVTHAQVEKEKIRLLGIQMSHLFSEKVGEQLWLF
ncbi:MAG: DNA polymerase IV [Turneriella sp.]|nr:DNA polymerase IV [Turneriella sp.]